MAGRIFSFYILEKYVFCGDKSIIKTDYLIDDHLKNLDNFSRNSTSVFSFTQCACTIITA